MKTDEYHPTATESSVSTAKAIADSVDIDAAEDLLTKIHEHDLPPVLAELVEDYQALPDARPPFMWKWVHRLAPHNTLPCVQSQYTDRVPIDKTLLILFVTLLDDALEKRGDRATFQAAASIPFPHRQPDVTTDDVDSEYVAFAERVWHTIDDRLQQAPSYERYRPLLLYDVRQAINAIEYSHLVIEHPDLGTFQDLRRYESHNMVMAGYADIDLMYSPPAAGLNLGDLRAAIWQAQLMTRIGNWLSTWRRELREGDYSSGIVMYALENNIITHDELKACEAGEMSYDELIETIERAGTHEHFYRYWDACRDSIQEINSDLTTMDLTRFIEGLDVVLRYHLASEGLK